MPPMIVLPRSIPMLRRKFVPLIFLTRVATTRNAVHPIRKNPFRLEMYATPVFSNNAVTTKNTNVKMAEVQIMYLSSFLRNGSAKKKNPIGNIKNCMPPHEARPNARKIPPPTIFAREIFPLSDFMALITRYTDNNPKKRPSGSDLNQPMEPLIMIIGETAKNNEARSPAVVPPIVLTRAKIIIAVSELTTTGNHTVKS